MHVVYVTKMYTSYMVHLLQYYHFLFSDIYFYVDILEGHKILHKQKNVTTVKI